MKALAVSQTNAHHRPCETGPSGADLKSEAEGRTVADLAQALTSLKAYTTEMMERKRQLRQLNRWFEVALNNMGRGLSMFDAERRLIVCNKLYREIYDLPTKLTRPGTPLTRIVRFHAKQEGRHYDATEIRRQCQWLEKHVAKLKVGQTFSYTQQLKNGRIVQVTTQPLSGGGWVDIQEDITERRRAEQKIIWLANHDPLTRVANRGCFSDELSNALSHLAPGAGIALHWIDLDRFKQVNDSLGHPVGDALLKSVAARLIETTRPCDLVARLGGDEFAVIQAGVTTRSEAEELTKRLLAAVLAPHEILGREISIGASIGVVMAPQHGKTAEELMTNVDLALYWAKQSGRAKYCFFDPDNDYAGQDPCEGCEKRASVN